MESLPTPRADARVRWGLPDVVLAWLAGLVFSLFAFPFADADAGTSDQPVEFLVAALTLQNLGVVLALVWIAKRKGRGSLRQDFGFVWPWDRLRALAVAGWIAAGAGLSIVANIILVPIAELADLEDPAQEVSQTVERANGVGLAFLVLGIVVLVPFVEELLFRGALLRGLQRRFSAPVAIFISAAIFAAMHPLGDPEAVNVVPAILLLGLVSGYQASKHGNLARSVLLHAGFNLLATIFLVA